MTKMMSMEETQHNRDLPLEALRITEAAALAAHAHMGQGDEETADQAAVDAVFKALSTVPINGNIRIGEGIRADVENLYVGQSVGGGGGAKVDIAVVPLEGTSIIARGGFNALSAIALAEHGAFLSVPAVYMEKIAVGSGLAQDILDLDDPPAENLARIAKAKGLAESDLVVCILDRPRHRDLIRSIRKTGTRIRLIMDGDLSGAVATARATSGIDVYMGTGLAPQGVLAAAALRSAGGQFHGRLIKRNKDDARAIEKSGIDDISSILTIDDLVPENITFAATGITSGPLLQGIKRSPYRSDGYTYTTHSMVLRSSTGTWREVTAHHHLDGMVGR